MKLSARWLVVPGLIVGMLAIILSSQFKQQPPLSPKAQSAKRVDVLKLEPMLSAPQISGYGLVKPKYVWEAIAEVSGRIVYKHPQLEQGAMLMEDTLLLSIDPLEYQLQVAQAQASVAMSETQLQRSLQEQKNLQFSVDIEQQRLALANDELARKQSLLSQKLISNSELEAEKQTVLAQRKALQELENQLSLWPADHQLKQAQLKVDQSKLADAQRRLATTEIRLPFDAKVAELNIEQDQVANQGSRLLIAERMDKVEVELQVSLADMRRLVLNNSDFGPSSTVLPSAAELDIKASLQLASSTYRGTWPAKVSRFSDSIKPEQGTVGLFLDVEQDLSKINIEQRMPLTKGMYVKGVLTGQAAATFVVPERSLHQQRLYLVDAEQRLKIVPIQELYRNQDGVAVSGDISSGDLLVLNDLIPAVVGMRLRLAEPAL